MDSYVNFASVYDMYMDTVPYDIWADHAVEILNKYQVPKELVCELGCGTGEMTGRLCARGYDMIGIDISVDMLDVARDKEYSAGLVSEDGPQILYLNQDMREFELFGTVRAIVSFCDSINYITNSKDLLTVFKLCNNYLDPGGILLFDINSYYKYSNILMDQTFAENREEGSFIWENSFDGKSGMNTYDLTLYIRNEDDTYSRFEEEHLEKAYKEDEIINLINQSGLKFLEMLDADTMTEVTDHTERIYFIAQECMKNV